MTAKAINNSDFVIIRKDDFEKIKNAASNVVHSYEGDEEGIAEGWTIHDLKMAMNEVGVSNLSDSLRVVQSQDVGAAPVLLILPPKLTNEDAVTQMDAAIQSAGIETNNGMDDDYFTALGASLAKCNIALTELDAVSKLHCRPWDEDSRESEPEQGDPDWVVVEFGSSDDEPDELAPTGTTSEGKTVEFIEGVTWRAFCDELTLEYPRSDKYGTPEAATDKGAREYVRDAIGALPANDFQVFAEDRGDDGVVTFTMKMRVHKDCLRECEVEQDDNVSAAIDRP